MFMCKNEDYICRENSWQIAIIYYVFSVNFNGSIFFTLDICRENWCTETYIGLLKLRNSFCQLYARCLV